MSRAVVITGASTGIGRETALHLDRLGFRVFAGVRKDRDAESLQKEASQRLKPIRLDVTDPNSIASARSEVESELRSDGLYGLVNNAGIAISGALEFIQLDEFRRQLEVNVMGLLATSQTFLPLIRKARGRIVHVGSIGGKITAPILGPYAASKYAVEAISDAMRQELAPSGIRVSLIQPGAIATPIWEKGQSSAQIKVSELSSQEREYYLEAYTAIVNAVEQRERDAIPPIEVARRVEHALTAAKPKARYLVGIDAKVQFALSFLPSRWRDAALRTLMKYPKPT